MAVQLDLETEGFAYEKWGATQRCKALDWVVNNAGDVYTVDAEVFARTYTESSPGQYVKTAAVWAEVAAQPGAVTTKEGATHYEAGDYLVSNDAQGRDAWAITAAKFAELYELDDSDSLS